ncbi:alpha-amylase [Plakobranchus ocellatus]|uniref:alpha-amylase n=1 Tax=Plakobranchus ocellatus TaxID=259542 RepID=A0AAV3YF34_9GAST|nr:alpha-amylase [Plakobranchus ocellatus]
MTPGYTSCVSIFGPLGCWQGKLCRTVGPGSVAGDYTNPHCKEHTNGIVHLFEWKWSDIEKECSALSLAGFCGVQTSVPTEHFVHTKPVWWERYLPVSYRLVSRSGNEEDFYRMVQACNAADVRVFVSLELNHMSPGSGPAYGGTYHEGNSLNYPGVPYNASHFHTDSDCSNPYLTPQSPPEDMQRCSILGYPDLDQSNSYVKQTMVDLFNKFISMGVTGFFLQDAIHISPQDLQQIFDEVQNVPFGGRPFVTSNIVNTVPSTVEPSWYYPIGRVTDFTVSEKLGKAILEEDLSSLCDLFTSSGDLSRVPPEQSVVFVHEETYQRGRTPPTVQVITYKNPDHYNLALSLVVASGYGIPKIMSGYEFEDADQGPPLDDRGNIRDVIKKTDEICGNSWVCEHRLGVLKDAIAFSNEYAGEKVSNCKASTNTLSFSRGDSGQFWARVGDLDRLREDPTKENMAVEDLNNASIIKVWEFGQNATVAFIRGTSPTTVTTTESMDELTSTESEITVVTTIAVPTTESRTVETETSESTTLKQEAMEGTTLEQVIMGTTRIPTAEDETTRITTTVNETTRIPTTVDETTRIPTAVNETTRIPTVNETTRIPTVNETTRIPTTVDETTSIPTTMNETIRIPTVNETTRIPTTVDETTSIPTTMNETIRIPTTVLQTTIEATTVEQTTVEQTTMESVTVEQTTMVPTTVEETTMETTTLEPTTVEQKTVTLDVTTPVRPIAEKTTSAPTTTMMTTTERREKLTTKKLPNTTTKKTTIKPIPKPILKPTPPTPKENFHRTVILIKKITEDKDEVFIRGFAGVSQTPIPIKHNTLPMITRQRDRWIKGDNFLDYSSRPEKGQTAYGNGGYAKGTPAQWTSNKKRHQYYYPLNIYGEHYWVVDVQMDCLKTENGFFQFRGYTQNGYPENILSNRSSQRCKNMPRSPPRKSSNTHFAMCGKINVFNWGYYGCQVLDF